MRRSGSTLAVAAALTTAVASAPAVAFDFVVTRYDDPVPDGCLADDCSLREAVIAANADSDADRILLSAGVHALDLAGVEEDLSTVGDLDLVNSVELVGAGAGMTVLDGTGLGAQMIRASKSGASFVVRGLTLTSSEGVGLSLGHGSHLVEQCEVRDGLSGIFASLGSTLTLRRSTVSSNSQAGLTVSQGSAIVENSTISGNGQVEIVVSEAPIFSCTHCTIFDPADTDVELLIGNTTASFANSAVSGTCSLGSGGSIDSLGGNVESTGDSCQFDHASDQVNVVAQNLALGALGDNGGTTRTHLPTALSVLDGSANDALCLATDQRGVERSTNCEPGAVERGTRPATPIFHDGFLQGDTEAWSDAVGEP